MNIILSIIGSFLNRVRGGLFKNLSNNKIFYPLFIGVLACYVTNWSYQGFVSGFLACFVGQQIVGWGAYIGSLTCGAKPSPECEMIDIIVNSCKITIDKKIYMLKEYSRTWGFVALGIRGLIWSFLIGLSVQSLYVQLCGLLMPVCYLLPTLVLWKTKYHNTKTAWNCGEWLWGLCLTSFILWG